MMSAISAGSRIAFVTEGGPDVGLGHLSRCVALARAAAADGARASFLVCEDAQVASLLRDVHAEVLRVPWQVDPARALRTLSGLAPDAIVVDSYAASSDFLASLRRVAQVVAVDDMADRPLPVDVVVNGGAGAEGLPYGHRPDTIFLLGPPYALLDPSYAAAPGRAARDRARRRRGGRSRRERGDRVGAPAPGRGRSAARDHGRAGGGAGGRSGSDPGGAGDRASGELAKVAACCGRSSCNVIGGSRREKLAIAPS